MEASSAHTVIWAVVNVLVGSIAAFQWLAEACRSLGRGLGVGPRLADVEHDEAQQRLEQERERLERIRTAFADDHLHEESEDERVSELSHLVQHAADVASETFEREKDFSILEEVEAELADVERALQRLDDGTYGSCEVCREVIDDARLDAMPATRFCIGCQTEAELTGRQ